MIPANNIKQIIKELASNLSIYFLRADTMADVSQYPYLSYKNINTQNEHDYQDITTVTENATDPTSADITRYEKNRATISLSFIDKNSITDLNTYVNQAIQWFKSIDGREFCETYDIIVRLIGTAPEDRSVFQEAFWENRVGFDVIFEYSGTYTQTIEAVETIEITPTIDGEEKEQIIIEEV